MDTRTFARQFALVFALGLAALLGLYALPFMRSAMPLAWVSLCLFGGLSGLAFALGKATAQHPNPNRFFQFMMLFIGAKMLLSVLAVLLYNTLAAPPDKYFLLPFFAFYVLFTAFESLVLIRLSRAGRH